MRKFVMLGSLIGVLLGPVSLVPFAQAKIVPVSDYARLPAIDSVAISPDGKYLAAVVSTSGQYVLRVFNLADASDKKVRATSYPKGVRVAYVKWANNDQVLVSMYQSTNVGGTMIDTGHLFVLNKDLSKSKSVLKAKKKQAGASRFNKDVSFRQFSNDVVDFLPNDSKNILMSYGDEDQFSPNVYKVNLKSGLSKRIKNGAPNIQRWKTDLQGEIRVSSGQVEHNGIRHLSIRTVDGNWKAANEYAGLSVDTSVYGFMADPNEMIIGAYNNKNTLGLYIYDLTQQKMVREFFHHDQYDADGIIVSSNGKKIVGARYTADQSERVFFDPVYKARMKKIQAKLPEYTIRFIDETPDGQKVVFKASASSIPDVLYVYDVSSGKMNSLGTDYPEIGNTLQGDVTKVRYTARDGYKIPGYITTPPKIADGMPFKNLPFVILPHGGPYGRDTASFDYLAQFFTSRGYSVLQMNFRGSDGLGLAHQAAGRKNWVVMQEDVEDGERWLIKKGYADPKKICIVGWSYGGYAALMAAAKNPDLYVCAASIAGLTNPLGHVEEMKKYRFGQQNMKSFILNGFDGRDDIKANSPVKRAGDIRIPIFLAHGTKDSVVHFDQYLKMKRALGSSSQHKFIELKNGDHSLRQSDTRLKMLTELDSFLHKNLGDSAAAP